MEINTMALGPEPQVWYQTFAWSFAVQHGRGPIALNPARVEYGRSQQRMVARPSDNYRGA